MINWITISTVMAPIVYFFFIYSFLGWLLENIHSYITKGFFFKDNFFIGPFKPMYGVAPLLLVAMITPSTHWTHVIFLCLFIPTFVEYVTGSLFTTLFHKKWWDYSTNSLNFQGHICLRYSIYWLLLSLFCVYFLHPLIERSFLLGEQLFKIVWPAVLFYFLIELFFAVRRYYLSKYTIETLG